MGLVRSDLVRFVGYLHIWRDVLVISISGDSTFNVSMAT